ncbi:putative Polysaccharide transporter [Bradyrhizobium sp. ORS 278]|uniref:lipopolysaccharide biosynthesis protein n=1 Tax=Bradyrhizobium sp. (strain ORS 278) TaxID=114615 RepID=UPI0001508516|nr:polysaccharide transporter [Bradyrhizobium sp. ORS 278]CAL80635.1 putative Polysaccharide transporter [Bradyrhizobium sp. ORS 278]
MRGDVVRRGKEGVPEVLQGPGLRLDASPPFWSRLRARLIRAGAGNLSLGLLDQALLSGSAFALTLALANFLEVHAFGRFSVAWSFSILIESVFLRGLFDDGLPAAAQRIPRRLWPQLRFGLYSSALVVSGSIGLAIMLAGMIGPGVPAEWSRLAVATGLAVPAIRMQSVYRRIAYLDGRTTRAALSSLVYCLALLISTAVMIWTGEEGPAAAMSCIAVSATTAGALALLHRSDLARSRRQVLVSSLTRLLRGGRWFIATSLTYWVGSIGLIPFCSLLLGLEAGATLRILLLIFAPLSQFNQTIVSVRLPEIAEKLRAGPRLAIRAVARDFVALLGLTSVAYGAVVAMGGEWVMSIMVGSKSYQLGFANLALMALAMTLDSVWLGLALPLFAVGQPQRFLASRLAGLLSLCCALPVAIWLWGLPGAIVGMVVSSAVSVVVSMRTNWMPS